MSWVGAGWEIRLGLAAATAAAAVSGATAVEDNVNDDADDSGCGGGCDDFKAEKAKTSSTTGCREKGLEEEEEEEEEYGDGENKEGCLITVFEAEAATAAADEAAAEVG